MDRDEALAILRDALSRMTQSEVAFDVDVSEATVSRWLSAKAPPTKGLSKLVAWAERRMDTMHPLESHARITIGGSATLGREGPGIDYQLGVIAGHAAAVRQMLESALREQDRVLGGLQSLGSPAPSAGLTPAELRARLEETKRRTLEEDAAATAHPPRTASG